MIHIVHQRLRYRPSRTPGELLISGVHVCFTLEDELRELPGVPVEQWKGKERTAIPAGHYQVGLVDSPHFGKGTLALLNVPGFEAIRIHGGNTEEDTEGCVLVGLQLGADNKIRGGQSQPALKLLKERLVPALKAGEEVIWDIRNPPGYEGPVAPPASAKAKLGPTEAPGS